MNYFSLSDEALAELLILTVTANEYGTIYRNHLGEYHRIHGPAVILVHGGRRHWYHMGQRHRADGPAIEFSNGTKYWFLNDEQLTEEEWNGRVKSVR